MLRRVWVGLAAALVLPACADGGDQAGGSDAGVRSVMTRWAKADSPAAQCELVSSGFRFFIGNGDPTKTACVKHATAVIGRPAPGPLTIHQIRTDHGQTLVDASVGKHRTTYYLVRQRGTWKINSIGIREGLGPSEPPASVLDR